MIKTLTRGCALAMAAMGSVTVVAADVSSTTAADAAWMELWTIVNPTGQHGFPQLPGEGEVDFCLRRNEAWLRYRDEGLKFFERFTADPRRWDWLNGTLQYDPAYFKDSHKGCTALVMQEGEPSLYDETRQAQWDRTFAGLYAEFMAALTGPTALRPRMPAALLASNELSALRHRRLRGQSTDIPRLIERTAEYAARPDAYDPVRMAGDFLSMLKKLSLTREQELLVARLKQSPNESVRSWAFSQDLVTEMTRQPPQIKFTALDGREVDMQQLRGKVVLVDGWSIWCSVCISDLPKIKALYRQYCDQGFEVVGICFVDDPGRDEKKSLRVIRDTEVDWPIWLVRGQESIAYKKRYGITGMPVMWVFGKDGRLVTSGYLNSLRLEKTITELLD